jgi:hypothetical protein
MNCRQSENELALYVEGDLPQAKTSELDVHLLSCARCRLVVEELRETQSLFKGMKQETVSPQALAQLRTSVFGQIGVRNSTPAWGRWVYALAGIGFVVAVAVGVATIYRHSTANVQQVVQRQSVEPRSIERADVVINEQPPRPRLRRALPSLKRRGMGEPQPQRQAEPPKEIMVKLLTDDPNVVIYWLVDENGGAL